MQSEVPGSKIAGKLQTERDWNPEVRKSKFCRGKESFAVEKKVLPWKSKFCRGKVNFVVEKKVLPWKSKFCRGKESFAVAGMGHRTKLLKCLIKNLALL